jgi:hypothetical protein
MATAVALIATITLVAKRPDDAVRPRSPIAAAPAVSPNPDVDAPAPAAVPSAPPLGLQRDAPDGSSPRLGPDAPAPRAGRVSIAVVGGDPAQEAGFRAAVSRVNAGGRTIDLVGRTNTDAIATVNLSRSAVAQPGGAPSWVRGPLLETLTAPEDVLGGRVFSLSSPPERQARLLAAKVFPASAPSTTAVVYRGTTGVYAEQIPAALRDVLQNRGVRVVEFDYEPGRVVPLIPADAVFLSLDRDATLDFLSYARGRGYTTGGTIACIFPMLDASVARYLGDTYLVLSPYSLGSPADAAALEAASGRPISSGSIHGWVTGRALADALSRTGARTEAEAADALQGLTGYEHGFAPAYNTRAGGNVRTPDGILYEVQDGAYHARGGFETAPV